MRDQIRAIFAEFGPVEAEIDALMARRREVSRRYEAALAAFREANPAPKGYYWEAFDGKMVLTAQDMSCGFTYGDSDACGDEAVMWRADGEGRCETHKEG